jgi:hypothetical protein
MSRLPVRRRRRNPDDDVLFPYAERFSSETFPSLVYPEYDKMHVISRGASARAPSQVDGNLVFDAFFGEGVFDDFLTNPRRRSNGLAEYQRHLAKVAKQAATKAKKKVSAKKRPRVLQVAVVEREDGFRVVVLFRDAVAAMDGETELQMYTDWVRDFNEIESEHPMSRAEAMRLATEVAAEYRYGRAGKIVVHPLRRPKAKVASTRKPAAGAHVAYAAEEYMDNPRRKSAQNNAAKAMRLFHSGKAASLADAWAMVRRSR